MHKTVIVVDHTPAFAHSSNDRVYIGPPKGDASAANAAHITKSLWTCALEAALEYNRCVNDLLASTDDPPALVRFVCADDRARHIGSSPTNVWTSPLIANNLYTSLATIGPPAAVVGNKPDTCATAARIGVGAAVDALAALSDAQMADGERTELQRSRIILITQMRASSDIDELAAHVVQQVQSTSTITHVDLCIIGLFDVNTDLAPLSIDRVVSVDECLSVRVDAVHADHHLAEHVHRLLMLHYDLVRTVVADIPMRDSGQTSIAYDVPLLHRRHAHQAMIDARLYDAVTEPSADESLVVDAKRRTIGLHWVTSTAKFVMSTAPRTLTVARITPTSVNSAPSKCLVDFVKKGNSVLLEHKAPRHARVRPNMHTKLITHILTVHGGVLYIHACVLGKFGHEDGDAVSAGAGGKVSTYRTRDFIKLINQSMLIPAISNRANLPPNAHARRHLQRQTKHWPMITDGTMLYNGVMKVAALLDTMSKATLTDDDVARCRTILLDMANAQTRNEPLLASNHTCTKEVATMPRYDQYERVYDELEKALSNAAHTSVKHASVVNILNSCRSRPHGHVVVDTADNVLLTLETTDVGEIADGDAAESSRPPIKRRAVESSMQPSADNEALLHAALDKLRRMPKMYELPASGESVRVLDLVGAYRARCWATWRDADERITQGDKIELYKDLQIGRAAADDAMDTTSAPAGAPQQRDARDQKAAHKLLNRGRATNN